MGNSFRTSRRLKKEVNTILQQESEQGQTPTGRNEIKSRQEKIRMLIGDFQKLCQDITKINQVFKREKFLMMVGFNLTIEIFYRGPKRKDIDLKRSLAVEQISDVESCRGGLRQQSFTIGSNSDFELECQNLEEILTREW